MLTPLQRGSLRVILVSPRNPLNIGAAARAMANFGFEHLHVAAPYAPNWREARSAIGAPALLHDARESATLAEAVADCTLVVGSGTLTYRRPEQPVVTLPALGPLVEQEMARGGRVALIFGSEKHGLTREDLAHCHCLVEIPTDARQPSMNLGQAVAVCLYELAVRGGMQVDVDGPQAAEPAGKQNDCGVEVRRSSAGALERLAEVAASVMVAADYSPAAMRQTNQHDLRLLLHRMAINERDARRMMGLFRRVLYRLRRLPDKNE